METTGWISVQDKLPPLDTKVMAWLKGECYIGELSEGHEEGDPFLWHDEMFDFLARDLKPDDYWMPLPEPPK